MAIPVTEAQGTKGYLVATSVATSNATEIAAAILGGKEINCMQDVGDIITSRSVTEYKCISSDESAKSMGSISLPNINMDLLFDAADALGQADFRDMYQNNTRRKMILAFSDVGAGTTPTFIDFEIALSSDGLGITIDNAVMYKTVIEITSIPKVTNAA